MKAPLFLSIVLMLLLVSGEAEGRQNSYDSAEKIRTSFLVHVARYTIFPDSGPDPRERAFCFLENTTDEHYVQFKDILERFSIKSVDLTPVKLKTPEDFQQQQCDFAFIDAEQESQQLFAMLESKREETIFIGETNKFLENGGLVSLIERQAKVRVFINQQKYRGGVIRFSSRLLKHSKFR